MHIYPHTHTKKKKKKKKKKTNKQNLKKITKTNIC